MRCGATVTANLFKARSFAILEVTSWASEPIAEDQSLSFYLKKVELAMPIDGRRRFQGIILREDENGVAIELDAEAELVAQVHEMTKASLVLTDELIEAAAGDGTLPPQPGDDDFDGFETDEADDDSIEDNQESGA